MYNVIFLIISIFIFLLTSKGDLKITYVLYSFVVFIYCFVSVLKPINLHNTIYSYFKIPTFLYLFSFVLFIFPYLLHYLGFGDISQNSFLDVNFIEYANLALSLTCVFLLSYFCGYKLKLKIPSKVLGREESITSVNLVLIFLLIPTLILFLKSDFIQIFFQTKYSGSLTGDVVDDGIFFLLNFLISMGLAIASIELFKNRNFSFTSFFYFLLSGIFVLTLLFLGDRNLFLYHVLIFIGAFTLFFKTVKLKHILVLIFVGYFFYQGVEIFRDNREASVLELVDLLNENDPGNSFVEGSFGITTTGLRATFSAQENFGLFNGKFKLIGIAGIIPFSRGFIVKENDLYTTSSKVLKAEMIGKNASWGVGSNIISDIFLDFGLIGIVILSGLLGVFSKFVEVKVLTYKNLKWNVIYLLSLSLFTQIPRYSFDFPIRNLVWALIIFSIAKFVSRFKIF